MLRNICKTKHDNQLIQCKNITFYEFTNVAFLRLLKTQSAIGANIGCMPFFKKLQNYTSKNTLVQALNVRHA